MQQVLIFIRLAGARRTAGRSPLLQVMKLSDITVNTAITNTFSPKYIQIRNTYATASEVLARARGSCSFEAH